MKIGNGLWETTQFNSWVSESGSGGDEMHWEYESETTGSGSSEKYFITITAPDGTYTEQYLHHEWDREAHRPFGFGGSKVGRSYEDRVYSSGDVLMRRNLTVYEETEVDAGINPPYSGITATRDMRPVKQISITFEPGETNALATMSETVYDTTGNSDPAYFSSLNPKQTKSYHYVVVNASTATSANITTAAGWFSAATPATVTEMDYLYDANYKARNINGLVSETRVEDANGNVKAKSQITYDGLSLLSEPTSTRWENPGTNYRGLVTKTRSWHDIANNLYIDTQAQYDLMGNLRYSWDGNGNLSQVEYSSTYDYAYPTKTISPIPDSTGTYGLNDELETTTVYDYNTGLPTSSVDPNGLETRMEYVDPLLRPTKASTWHNSSQVGGETITEYGAGTSPSTRWVKSRSQIDATNWKEAISWFDGLGRTIKTQTVDSNGDTFVETQYDNMGRPKKTTNPYRNGETVYWTENTYDTAGRPWKVTTPDGAVMETTYGLATTGTQIGSTVTVTDQAGKHRRNISNVLGQLVRVDEPNASNQLGTVASPNQPTYYSYNTLGKMVKVNQGVQNRYFMHDSLGRMLRVRQPEQEVNIILNTSGNPENNSWSGGFTYDNNGNFLTATDAENTTITNTYDALNRPLTTTYSDGTPTVTNYYDGTGLPSVPANSKGKLTKVHSSISESKYVEFDVVGRLKQFQQYTDGQTYTSKYTYNLSGALVEEEYPSGRKVRNDFDSNGDIARIHGIANPTATEKTYATSFSYFADGRIEKLKLGNGLWESAKVNSRLQVTELAVGYSVGNGGLMKLNYDYGELQMNGTVDTAKNAGHIAKQTLSFNGLANPFIQSFTYDSLYRLKEAKETSNANQTWKQVFDYDRYGNRTTHERYTGTTLIAFDAATNPEIDNTTNRFESDQGYTFDKNGNVIIDGQGRQFTFNGDNKQTLVRDSENNVIGTYFYDGEGKRIKKVTNSETTVFVYSGGKLIAEYSTATPPQNPTTSYTITDQLGSPRVIVDALGQVVSRRDFLPFGEEVEVDGTYRTANQKYGQSDSVRQRFTNYQKDEETGLDFAEARMYENRHARFTAIDPLLSSGKSANPQTFNRYVYVLNSPLIFTDPTGLQVASWTGSVYTNGSSFSREPFIGENNSVIEGTHSRYVDATDGYSYSFNEAGSTLLGRTDVLNTRAAGMMPDATQRLVNGIGQPLSEAIDGMTTGAGNFGKGA